MNWRLWIGVLISVIFLYISFYEIDFYRLGQALKTANYFYLLPVAILYYLTYVFRAFRWYYLMEPIKSIGFFSLFSATVIGFMANLILPARMGEFVRAYQIGKTERISKSASFATIVIERLLDGFTVLGVLIIVLMLLKIPEDKAFIGQVLRKGGYFTLLFYLGIIAFLFLLRLKTKKIINLINRSLFFLPNRISRTVLDLISSFTEGIHFSGGLRRISLIIFCSIIIWATAIAAVFMAALSFDVYLSVVASMFVTVMIVFGVMVPSAPGFIGTYHAACLYALLFYNFPKEKALSIAIVMHASFFFPTMTLGLILLARQKITLKELKGVSQNI
nr:flippase-like domain-containing protein [Desulfobacterales bacterium]